MSLLRAFRLAGYARRHLGRMSRGRKEVLRHLESPSAANLPMPTFVQLRVTNLCNLRCRMCGQWGDSGIYRADGSNASAGDGTAERERIRDLIGAKRQLALADYVRLLDEIAPWDPIVSLFGGEPLLYPDVVPLVREVKTRGLTLSMITNGGRLADCAEELVEAGIDCIAVSVDGPHDLHDSIRGSKESFERLEAGIRAVAAARKRLGRANPMLLAILPVTELNFERIGEAAEQLRALPLDAVNVGLRWFVTPAAGAEYERVMQGTFGVSGASWKGFRFDWAADRAASAGEDAARMSSLVRLLRSLRRRRVFDALRGRPFTAFVPDVRAEDVPEYLTSDAKTFGHDLCPVAWYFAQVEPDGEVCFCGDFPDYFLGNVRTASFRDIWTGERANAFREKLAKEPLPVCARCCGSFVYGKWARPAAAAAGS